MAADEAISPQTEETIERATAADGSIVEEKWQLVSRIKVATDTVAIELLAEAFSEFIASHVQAEAETAPAHDFLISKKSVAAAAPLASDPELDTVVLSIPPFSVRARVVVPDGAARAFAHTALERLKSRSLFGGAVKP